MEQTDYRLAAIMYTDIAGFSRMMERDEAGTLELLKYHNELIGGIVERHHGSVIKTIGDALLVDFKNTVEALQSAMEVQDKLYEHNQQSPGLPLLVRIGVHLGDIYFFENDALGEGINIAARLQSLARPGCICFSQDVYNLVLNKIEFRAEKLGKVSLKNITKEIHAYEITTPNVEFDADRDKPRSGYKPGSYLDEDEAEIPVGGTASSAGPRSAIDAKAPFAAPKSAPTAAPKAAPQGPAGAAAKADSAAASGGDAERSYSEEGSRKLLTEIRNAILQDIKGMGRRMTVDEARERYSFYGVEADEVIAAMAEQGLLVKTSRGPAQRGFPSGPGSRGFMGGPGSAGGPFMPPFMSGFGRNERGEFDPTAIKNNVEAAVHGIVSEIERSVERNISGASRVDYAERYRERAEHYRRHAERHAMREELRRDSRESSGDIESLGGGFDAYKRRVEDRSRRSRGGLIGNLASYLAVNGFLFFLGLSVGGGLLHIALPIIAAAWGIGVVSSAVAASRASVKLREVDSMPELEAGQLADYKKLNRMKDSIVQHGATTIMVPVLLATINFVTGPSFLWFLIPSAAMLVGFFSHLASFAASRPRIERRLLDSLGVKGGWRNIFRQGRARRQETSGLGPYADLYREAEAAKEAIAAQLASGQAGPVDAELAPSLDQYLSQVRLLAQSAHDIDRLVEGIPMADLSRDKAELLTKESAASAGLKTEYRKSIVEIEKQESSYQELKEQSEVVRLRLGSSVNQLKQMRLDIARLQASPGTEGNAGIDQLKRRTDELSRYLEDLRSGYAETGAGGADPFAQLEREEKLRLAAAEAKPKGELGGPGPQA